MVQKIISDGSNGVIFNLALPITITVDRQKRENLTEVFMTGSTARPTYLTLQNSVKLIGIRFNFGGSYPFFQNRLHAYIDKVVKLDDLDWNEVLISLKNTNQIDEIIKILDNFLLKIILKERTKLTDWVLDVIHMLVANDGNITKDRLCSQFNVSSRQLERKFKEVMGLSIKQISMIIRTHRARELIRKNRFTNLTQIGYECGYFDQAHFSREFKKLTDTTPKLYRKQKTNMS